MKFHIIVYGCQMNYSDSARIKAVLTNCWFFYTSQIQDADIIIIDTCSVRQKAEDKVFGKLKEIPKDKKIWITGCMIQHNLKFKKLTKLEETVNDQFNIWNFQWNLQTKDPFIVWLEGEDIQDIIYKLNKQNKLIQAKQNTLLVNSAFNPLYKKIKNRFKNLELIFRIDDLGYIPIVLKNLWYKISTKKKNQIINEYTWIFPTWSNQSLNENLKSAYIPIQTGCSQFCAYCIVPYARWLEKNRKKEDIINEVEYQIQKWIKEIILVGQIVNKHPQFAEILKKILKFKEIKWLRYTSPYPNFYNDELFQLHQDEPKLCPHIHIPAQSGSNKILKKMFRWYSSQQFKEFIDKIKSLNRDISITTDMIIWFPWETENDFQKSLDLVKYSNFDMIFMWIYSPRPGTIWARKYSDDIPYKTKKQRWHEMNELLKKISYENNQREVWKTYNIIIDDVWESAIWHNKQMKNIILHSKKDVKKLKIGDIASIQIKKWDSFNLYGSLISSYKV